MPPYKNVFIIIIIVIIIIIICKRRGGGSKFSEGRMVLVMVFGTLLCLGFKAILRIALNLSSLGPVDVTLEKFHVASHMTLSLDPFSS